MIVICLYFSFLCWHDISGYDKMTQGYAPVSCLLYTSFSLVMKWDSQDYPYWVTTGISTIYQNLGEPDCCAANCV